MKIIACIDDRGGMLFNCRRVSSDKAVIEKILQLTSNSKLFVSPYSYKLFSDAKNVVCIDKMPLTIDINDWYFVENSEMLDAIGLADTVVLFHWNRKYPADVYFPMDALTNGWQLTSSEEFSGNSHEQITMEVYCR